MALPTSSYCFHHILQDPAQVLFKPCGAILEIPADDKPHLDVEKVKETEIDKDKPTKDQDQDTNKEKGKEKEKEKKDTERIQSDPDSVEQIPLRLTRDPAPALV